jgi:hypothetical protein
MAAFSHFTYRRPRSSREWARGTGFCRFPVFGLRPKRNGWQASHGPHSRWTIASRLPYSNLKHRADKRQSAAETLEG